MKWTSPRSCTLGQICANCVRGSDYGHTGCLEMKIAYNCIKQMTPLNSFLPKIIAKVIKAELANREGELFMVNWWVVLGPTKHKLTMSAADQTHRKYQEK